VDAVVAKLAKTTLVGVARVFLATFFQYGTEDRILIYADEHGGQVAFHPDVSVTRASVTCDVPLVIERDGRLWDLAFDLHSHHEKSIGAHFSPTDDANEHIRGPVFGVYSWYGGMPAWCFRRFNGVGFEYLQYEAVVAGDQ
jgi:hypothetical protein